MELASHGHLHVHRTFDPSQDNGPLPSTATAAGYAASLANKLHHQQFHQNPPPRAAAAAMSAPNAATSPLVHSQGHTSSNYSIQSQPSSRSSDTTQGTTHSTLFPLAPPVPSFPAGSASAPPNGHDVMPTDNIMNSVADASSSLFQICVALRQRLQGVPGVNQCLVEEEKVADADTDPVTLLWRTFRRGYPLMLLYNALQPAQALTLPQNIKEEKRAKMATFKFASACKSELSFPQEECFIITDLYGDDTTGFVKVARAVNRLLDLLVKRGLIEDVRPTASDFEEAEKGIKRTQRQHIISELVTTERTYVQHLELLQAFKRLVEEKGIVPGDAVHDIFLNLNSLLDFQRRFLIRVEQTNALHENDQNWGRLFILYSDAFKVYEPYIANQRKCEKTVVAEFPKLREAGGSIEMRQMVESSTSLYGFLMKPFQRLSKYPLLLEDLYKKGDLDEEKRQDLQRGKEAATSVLSRTNQAVALEERAEAVQELKMRVEDWKGHKVEVFGDLLMYGTFTVLKSEVVAAGKDAERQYQVYLFETILLCCKNIDLNKPKNKLSSKNLTDPRGKPKLQLKGRIFMQNVTDLLSLAKPGMDPPNNTFLKIGSSQRIFWKGDPGIENFIIRFTSEDVMRKWAFQIQAQRAKYRESRAVTRRSDGSKSGSTSTTEFHHLQNQPPVENPYKLDVDDDDDDDDDEPNSMTASINWSAGGYPNRSDYAHSLNGSSSSLRSRSTTGDSSQHPPPIVSTRSIPPRLPQGSLQQQHLTLRTQELQHSAVSPGSLGPVESYFSPIADNSPMSVASRTSASSAVYSFPRQPLPQNGYYEDGHGATRFTAPAMGRSPISREHSGGPSNTYAPPGRGPLQRPGHPPGPGMHSVQQMPMPPRNRSASSPDIHNVLQSRTSTRGQPPVPDVPASYQHPHPIVNRSQSNSPSLVNGVPGRDSPQLQRERQYSQPDATSPIDHMHGDPRGISSRTITPVPPRGQFVTPQPSAPPPNGYTQSHGAPPAQLKVKVHCPSASQTLTLVVPNNITYQTLKDRIDAKLQRSTNLSLSDRAPRETQVKLKYKDEEDLISIQSDEDVQIAFETWREQKGEVFGGMGEIELYCTK